MKKTDDQIDFNFSRVLDIQKNLDVNFLDTILAEIKTDKKTDKIEINILLEILFRKPVDKIN